MNPQQIAADFNLPVEEVRSRWLQLRVALWKSDFRLFCKEAVRIRAKDGDLIPLILNDAQEILLKKAEEQLKKDGWVRLLGTKSRRQGFSSLVAARGFHRATLYNRQHVFILSHTMDSSNALFDMVALMQEHHPFPSQVGTDNAKSLSFPQRGSMYQVATAGQKAGGRGAAISFLHASEAAWWQSAPEHWASIVQAVDEVKGVWGVLWKEPETPLPFERGKGTIEGWVKAPSEVWAETTAAGPTGEWYKRWQDASRGIGRYQAVFVPWYVTKEYQEEGDFIASREPVEEGFPSEAEYQELYNLTDRQMLWYRGKLQELGSQGRMFQEFPSDESEAFSSADMDDAFIKPMLVLQARKRKMEDPDAPLILGVDPAGAGGDRFAVAARRGDKCLWVKHRNKIEHDEAVAWLCALIDEHQPARMCIDKGSIGQNIVSAIRNRGPKYADIVRGADFGGKSSEKKANPNKSGPFNVRASIWGRMREWLLEGGCIPDQDDLASDLSAPKILWRANNDYILESKSVMKSRGVRSPDGADALALTFFTREFFSEWSAPKKATGFTKGVDYSHQSRDMSNNTDPYSWMGSL